MQLRDEEALPFFALNIESLPLVFRAPSGWQRAGSHGEGSSKSLGVLFLLEAHVAALVVSAAQSLSVYKALHRSNGIWSLSFCSELPLLLSLSTKAVEQTEQHPA